jgi:hypothetical protein
VVTLSAAFSSTATDPATTQRATPG